ncbi:MAG: hypothetical protein MRY83_04675, partial [Flavobacteriales bacterium]|nr:hypothetical protein [Flavobacteriales bacterium]
MNFRIINIIFLILTISATVFGNSESDQVLYEKGLKELSLDNPDLSQVLNSIETISEFDLWTSLNHDFGISIKKFNGPDSIRHFYLGKFHWYLGIESERKNKLDSAIIHYDRALHYILKAGFPAAEVGLRLYRSTV